MPPLLSDVRLALRRLRRTPGFTLFAVASLAVGIGASTAFDSAMRTLLWMPAVVPDEGGLVAVTTHRSRSAGPFPGPSGAADLGVDDCRGALDPVTIVGVARDIKSMSTALRPDRIVFVPLAQRFEGRARARGEATASMVR